MKEGKFVMQRFVLVVIIVSAICMLPLSIVSAAPVLWEEIFTNDEIDLFFDKNSVSGRSETNNGVTVYQTYVVGKYLNKVKNEEYIFELLINDKEVTALEGTFCKNKKCQKREVPVEWKVPQGSVSRLFVEEVIAFKKLNNK